MEVPVKGRYVISNAIGSQECAIANMGLALLPHWLTETEIKAGKSIQVLPEYEVTATDFEPIAWLVYPSRSYVPQKVRASIEFLKQRLVLSSK